MVKHLLPTPHRAPQALQILTNKWQQLSGGSVWHGEWHGSILQEPQKGGTAESLLSHFTIRGSHVGSALWGSSISLSLSFKRCGSWAGLPDPLVPAGLDLRSCMLGCSYQDLSGLISMQDLMDSASAFLKQWVVTTIPIFPYKCLRGWVIGKLDTVFMWLPSLYLPWRMKLDKTSVCKNKQR